MGTTGVFSVSRASDSLPSLARARPRPSLIRSAGILAMPYFQATFKTGTTGTQVGFIACLYTM